MRGGGVEFLPRVDDAGVRKAFIDGLARDNRLRAQINCMAVRLMTHGRILLYLRPVARSYRIHWYAADQYECEYDRYGEIEAATIVYAYKRRGEDGRTMDRWVKIRLTAQTVQVQESDSKLGFTPTMMAQDNNIGPNRIGFVPCVEVLNPTPASAIDGVSDFAAIAEQLEAHDQMTTAIVDAIIFYCQSPILTSREASEVSEALGAGSGAMPPSSSPDWPGHESVSYASGFRDVPNVPMGDRRRRRKLKRVIGGVDPQDDTFQQLSVGGVSGELVQYADNYERQLREALGGIMERGIESATETRVVYGKVQATARDKRVALFEQGLCRLLEMAIQCEEVAYLATAGMAGLPALGDRTVIYRVAPLFLEGTSETLQKSIVSRNLMRQGVNAREALRFVFPDKSENELDTMVGSGGLPTEYLEAAMRVMQQLIALTPPDPLTGLQLPVSDPVTNRPLWQVLLPFLTQSLNYGSQFNSTSPVANASARRRDADALVAALYYNERAGGFLSADNPQSDGDVGQDPSESLPDPGTIRRSSIGGSLFDFSRSPILNGVRRFLPGSGAGF